MKETRISLPELALIAGTRAALGAGLGLLLSNRLTAEQRKAAGWTLVAIGALSTIPLAFEVLGGGRVAAPAKKLQDTLTASHSKEDGRMVKRNLPTRA